MKSASNYQSISSIQNFSFTMVFYIIGLVAAFSVAYVKGFNIGFNMIINQKAPFQVHASFPGIPSASVHLPQLVQLEMPAVTVPSASHG
jgi:hypothetical protein